MSTGNIATVKRILEETIYYHLDNYLFNNALFFAERLTASDPNSTQTRRLLGLCHFRLDDYHSTIETLKPALFKPPDLGCTWIYAQSCFALKRYKDGAAALEKSKYLWPRATSIGKTHYSIRGLNPDPAALLCLLGKLYRELDDSDRAVHNFESALRMNPFMWDAFTSLCDIGVTVSVPNVFKCTDSLMQNFDWSLEGGPPSITLDSTYSPLRKSSARASSKANEASGNVGGNRQTSSHLIKNTERPAAEPDEARPRVAAMADLKLEATELPVTAQPESDSRPLRNAQTDVFRDSVRKARRQVTEMASAGVIPRMTQRMGGKKNSRREGKVRDEEQHRMKDASREPGTSATSTNGRKRLRSEDPVPARPSDAEEAGATRHRGTTTTSSASSSFQAPGKRRESHNAPNSCPPRQSKKARHLLPKVILSGHKEPRNLSVEWGGGGNSQQLEDGGIDPAKTSMETRRDWIVRPLPIMEKRPDSSKVVDSSLRWTLGLLKTLGTGYYALSRFQCEKALKAYGQLPHDQEQTPWVLGQMGRVYFEQGGYHQAERVFQTLRAIAPTRHRDMECALGNTFSRNREHEPALKCFSRASQLDPVMAYPHTLQGHEYVACEDYEKALTAYRSALGADKRHYNAYYGIAKVYEKLGSLDKAYAHFLAASSINPANAVLTCSIGTVLEKQGHLGQALRYYNKATELAPKAAYMRFKKARVLLVTGEREAAREELMIVKDLTPNEATVHFLLGNLYKAANEKHQAMRHFTYALALDPKASTQIKEAIESLDDSLKGKQVYGRHNSYDSDLDETTFGED